MTNPQPGEIWEDREGRRRGPLMAHNNGYYSLTDGAYTWKGDGSSLNPWEESPRDLIRRIDPPEYAPGVEYPWTGGKCPVPGDTLVEVTLRNGYVTKPPVVAGCTQWGHLGLNSDIVAFKIVAPDAPTNHLADAYEAYGRAILDLAEAIRKGGG